jgi:hypothetical protein
MGLLSRIPNPQTKTAAETAIRRGCPVSPVGSVFMASLAFAKKSPATIINQRFRICKGEFLGWLCGFAVVSMLGDIPDKLEDYLYLLPDQPFPLVFLFANVYALNQLMGNGAIKFLETK